MKYVSLSSSIYTPNVIANNIIILQLSCPKNIIASTGELHTIKLFSYWKCEFDIIN